MIKCKFLVRTLMLATLAAGVTACSGNEPIESLAEAGENTANESSRITITIQGPGDGTLTYPGMVTSRAEIQTEDEKRIYSLQATIFQLKDGGDKDSNEDFTFVKSYYFSTANIPNPSETKTLGDYATISLDGNNYISELVIPESLHGKTIKVILFSNFTEEQTYQENTTFADVMNDAVNSAGGVGQAALHGDKYFLMSGIAKCDNDETPVMSAWGIKMSAELVRLVARIDIKNNTPGLTINEATLSNAASHSYILKQSSLSLHADNKAVTFSPYFDAIGEYAPLSYVDGGNTKTAFYTFEKPVTSESESPCVNIKYSLKYEGSDITSKGEINVLFKNEKGFVNVDRNHLYTIVLGDGNAITDGLINAKFVVNEWNLGREIASEMDPDSDTRVEDSTESGN